MGFVTSPLVSHAGPISGQHRAPAPTEVRPRTDFGPPGGKPRGSRGVTELVGWTLSIPAWAHRRSSIWAMPLSDHGPLGSRHSAGEIA